MAINFRSNTIIKNLRVGPLSGGGNGGGGGGSSEPSYLVVGAYRYGSADSGAAYVYSLSDLSSEANVLNAGSDGDRFGYSVAATSNQIVVGAYLDDDIATNSGAVYVYDANNLSATPTILTPSGLDIGDEFGGSVAATSNLIIVGAGMDDDQGNDAGAVYVYDATNLSATPTKLAPSALSPNDYFGRWNIAATSNQIIIAAPYAEAPAANSGAVYVYDANNLSATPTKLAPSSLGEYDEFGNYGLAATSNYIAVSAREDDDRGYNSGAVYVYDANNLSATPTKITAYDGASEDRFGQSIAISNNFLAVGSTQDDDRGLGSGAVYVYDITNLSTTPTKLVPTGLGEYDYFGTAVVIAGDKLIASAINDDDNGSNTGALYIYDLTDLSLAPSKVYAPTLYRETNSSFGASMAAG